MPVPAPHTEAGIASVVHQVPGRRTVVALHGELDVHTVRRLEARTNELAAAVHSVGTHLRWDHTSALKQVREAQRILADEMRTLEDQTAARDRQLHWVLARQTEQFHDLIADAGPRGQRNAA